VRCAKANTLLKAQVSLELLLVLGALAALLAAFAPLISEARSTAGYAVAAKQLNAVLAQTAADCREARLGGVGSVFSREWFLPVPASFASSGSELSASFDFSGEQRTLVEDVGFECAAQRVFLSRGSAVVRVENAGGVVKAVFQPAK
jgi:hypothetical protein